MPPLTRRVPAPELDSRVDERTAPTDRNPSRPERTATMSPSIAWYNESQRHDVLTLSLAVAVALHALIILGVSFKPFMEELHTQRSLEVILVPRQTDAKAPEEADYLAATNQDGGGESDTNSRPSSPFYSELNFDSDGIASTPVVASSPAPQQQQSEDTLLTSLLSEQTIADTDIDSDEIKPEARQDMFLIEETLEIARLNQVIEKQVEDFAKRPRKQYVNARTRQSTAAEYMYDWVARVERMGNLNYPDAVRLSELTGSLVLTVGIYKNGEIESVLVEEGSGHKLLDDAARRIVELAGPFSPMTGELAAETDILYITRTWEFKSGNTVVSY